MFSICSHFDQRWFRKFFSSSAIGEVYEKSEEYSTSDMLDEETQDNISTTGRKELSNIAELLP